MRPHKLFCLSILFCFLNLMTLVARATDAKICLWQIKHRRVQTAAVGLCRGIYVFVGRVEPIIRHTLSSGLCSGVCKQPLKVFYAGVFIYSLAGRSCVTCERGICNSRGDRLILLTVLPAGCYFLFWQKGKSDKCQDNKCQAYNK